MKNKSLIIILLIIVINIVFFNINRVQAEGISDVITGGDSFISAGKSDSSTTINEDKLISASGTIYNILLIIGMCGALIVVGFLGIKFMIGSAEEKAQVKDSLVPFIIGCIVIFGAFGFWKISVDVFSKVDSSKVQKESDDEKTDSSGGSAGSVIDSTAEQIKEQIKAQSQK